jgi:hypothetical protein
MNDEWMDGSDTFYCTSYGVGNELNWIQVLATT